MNLGLYTRPDILFAINKAARDLLVGTQNFNILYFHQPLKTNIMH